MSEENTDRFVLHLEGSRARRGILLQDLEDFIDGFLKALRGHDRALRGEAATKAGHPERRDQLVTAFRLVDYRQGSAILTIEPAIEDLEEDNLDLDVEALPSTNLASLLESARRAEPLNPEVARSLEAARRHLGDDGRFQIRRVDEAHDLAPVIFDAEAIRGAATPRQAPFAGPVTVSGRLHAIDLEPGRVQIRAVDGADWRCTYAEEMEPDVTALLGALVWARGTGRKIDARRGEISIDVVREVAYAEESPLFTRERVPIDRLMAEQGITGPQGLASLADPGWDDDDPSCQAFLATLLDE